MAYTVLNPSPSASFHAQGSNNKKHLLRPYGSRVNLTPDFGPASELLRSVGDWPSGEMNSDLESRRARDMSDSRSARSL